MKRVKLACILVMIVMVVPQLLKAAPIVSLSLADLEQKGLAKSELFRSAQFDSQAAQYQARVVKAALAPRLNIEGNYNYVTIVPELAVPIPNFPPVKFSDNTSYSIGPTLHWTLFDENALHNSWLSAQSMARSKMFDAEAVRRQVLLQVRNTYLQLALAAEQTVLLSDALNLSLAQYNDIKVNVEAGTKSRSDKLSSHQDLLSKERSLSQARADMAQSLRDLSDLTGVVFSSGVSIPIDVRAAGSLPDDVTAPSVEIELDSHDRLYQRFASFQMEHLWQDHPSLSSLTELAKAAHQTADSASAGYWPTFQLMARTSLDYPNGPILEKFNQTSAGVTVNWPLFDAGNTRNRIRQNEKISELNMEKHDQALADMTRDWNKAMDQIASLEEQKHINETAVSESAELVDIIYKAYKSGARTYLDVENADLQALEAKNQLAITRVHIVMNLVVLASLSEDNNPK